MISQKSEIGVVIADDHPIVRDGLRRLLQEEHMKVVGEAANGDEAPSLVRKHKPDILLLDLSMPTYSGMDALRDISKNGNPVRVILVTAHREERDRRGTATGCPWSGAQGYSQSADHESDRHCSEW